MKAPALLLLMLMSGCFGASRYSVVPPSQTKRVYVVAHDLGPGISAFDSVHEWIALSWVSAQSVVQMKNERTMTFVVSWMTDLIDGGLASRRRPLIGVVSSVRSVAAIRVRADHIRFEINVPSGGLTHEALSTAYMRWDNLIASNPWGTYVLSDPGYIAPAGAECESDRECERWEVCRDWVCAPTP